MAATNTSAPTATTAPSPTPVPHMGGWLDQVVFTAIADAPSAVAQLQAGAIDMYPVSASDPNVYATVKADKTLAYANVVGTVNQMILNPSTTLHRAF